eukprot:1008947-Pyramimonas_sp.AAC.1
MINQLSTADLDNGHPTVSNPLRKSDILAPGSAEHEKFTSNSRENMCNGKTNGISRSSGRKNNSSSSSSNSSSSSSSSCSSSRSRSRS